jgi:hypothetical protein
MAVRYSVRACSDKERNIYLCGAFYNNNDPVELTNTPVHEVPIPAAHACTVHACMYTRALLAPGF